MNQSELLFEQIRKAIQPSTVYSKVVGQQTNGKCIEFAEEIRKILEDKIPGLSLAVVENMWPLQVHGWSPIIRILDIL